MRVDTTRICNNAGNEAVHDGLCTENHIDVDIQVAYLNMLHEQGILSDNLHSTALCKVVEGVS